MALSKQSATDQAYADLKAIPFPRNEVLRLLGGEDDPEGLATFLVDLSDSLKAPFASCYFAVLVLTSFQMYRTVPARRD